MTPTGVLESIWRLLTSVCVKAKVIGTRSFWLLRSAICRQDAYRNVLSVLVAVAKDPLSWKTALVFGLIYLTLDIAADELLGPETVASVKAPILGLIAATGIAVNMIPGGADTRENHWYLRDIALIVNGVAGAVIATTGWFAAQQWLLSVSVGDSHYVLMFWLGFLALVGVYLGFLNQSFR